MPGLRSAVRREEAEVALGCNQRGPLLHHPADKDARREIETDHRDVGGLERERRRDGLRREGEHRLDGHVRCLDELIAGREGRTNGGTTEKIVPGPTDRVEDGLRRGEEAEAVRPAVVIRTAIRVLLRQREPVRRIVDRARAALVLAVFRHEQPALERMIVWREAETVRGTVAPRYRFDRALRVAAVELCSQDCTVADALPGRAREGLDGATRILGAEWRVAARLHPATRVEHVAAKRDVLAGDVRLIQAAAIVTTDHAGIGR